MISKGHDDHLELWLTSMQKTLDGYGFYTRLEYRYGEPCLFVLHKAKHFHIEPHSSAQMQPFKISMGSFFKNLTLVQELDCQPTIDYFKGLKDNAGLDLTDLK